jgi:hypothetical protein
LRRVGTFGPGQVQESHIHEPAVQQCGFPELPEPPETGYARPWIALGEGLGYDVPPGDVVVIHHRHGARVLPVHDAAAFADVIRLRAGKVKGSLSARSLQDTEQG